MALCDDVWSYISLSFCLFVIFSFCRDSLRDLEGRSSGIMRRRMIIYLLPIMSGARSDCSWNKCVFLRPFIRELNTTQRQYTKLVHFSQVYVLSNFLNIFHFRELNTTWQQYTMLVHFSKNYAGWNYDASAICCYQNLKNLTNNLIELVWFKSRLNVLFDLISWVTLITGWEDGLERAARWKPSVTRTLSVCAEPRLLPNSLEL